MREKAKPGRPRTFVAPTTVRFRGDQLEAIGRLAAEQDRDDAYIIRLLVDEALAARASAGRSAGERQLQAPDAP